MDAVVVGSGPNGLCAAIELARHGIAVRVFEAQPRPGGGVRSYAATEPGFVHDLCSAVHPLAVASPFLDGLDLEGEGLEWVHPDAPLAHVLEGEEPVLLHVSPDETAANLDRQDRTAWTDWTAAPLRDWDALLDDILRPLRIPRHPGITGRFALSALRSARGLAERRFRGPRARALLAGVSAHSVRPLSALGSAAQGVVLTLAGHAVGWPFPRGGAGALTRALIRILERLGGTVETSHRVDSLDELPPARATLLDLTPWQVLRIAGHRLPARYAHALRRYRYGPGVFKVDWALSEPIPWRHAAASEAGTVHVGGTLDEVDAAVTAPHHHRLPDAPFLILAQPSLFDATRAPGSMHTAWAYCHVPHGSPADRVAEMEAQIERYAPGFADAVRARAVRSPETLQRDNANLVGGDIGGGAQTLRQTVFRPAVRWDPYRTPVPGLFLCSSSTPPGGGVHGLCGARAADRALEHTFGIRPTPWSAGSHIPRAPGGVACHAR